nr:(S)-ureidoglycine--glyoxylate transaminase-like [Nerophis lumbriciformis]
MTDIGRHFTPPNRVLMGPGPSEVPAPILAALARPTIGHLDPEYLRLMEEISGMLRQVFRTDNHLTLALPGTGTSGMEATVANLIEPGDRMLVVVAGYFGGRLAEIGQRCGAEVDRLEVEWGKTALSEQVRKALARQPDTKVVAIVHAETSTGAHQPLEEISAEVHAAGALLLVDAVTSLAGLDLRVDDWQIDACYSGTQKCLSCPPGLSPVTFSPAAVRAIEQRTKPVQSFYLDLGLLAKYWGDQPAYHHTGPINMSYALHEALLLALEEGLKERIARHALNHRALRAGLEALGLRYIAERPLPMLNAVAVPAGVDDAKVRGRLLNEYGLEIGAGLGPFAGRAWRIGLMGAASSRRHVLLALAALESILADEPIEFDGGASLSAAGEVYG